MFAQEPPPDFDVPGRREPGERPELVAEVGLVEVASASGNVAPVDWFFNEYYYPGLLSDVFAGKRPKVALDISKKDRRQPIVKLSIPGNGATENISTRTVKFKI